MRKGMVNSIIVLFIWEFFLIGLWTVITGAGATEPLPLMSAIASDLGITVYEMATSFFIIFSVIGMMASFSHFLVTICSNIAVSGS